MLNFNTLSRILGMLCRLAEAWNQQTLTGGADLLLLFLGFSDLFVFIQMHAVNISAHGYQCTLITIKVYNM